MSDAHATVSVDDDRLRITRWTLAPGTSIGQHRHEHDYIVVPISGGTFTVTGADGSVRTMTQTTGEAYLGTAGTEHDVANETSQEANFVEVELKP
jgi:quercetin dioxygenase-like cupin family protein